MAGLLDSNQRMTESKSVALPLGYSPLIKNGGGGRFELPNPKERIYSPPRLATSLPLRHIWWRMTGSNRRPLLCKAGALPTELILHFAWQRPTLTGTRSQLPSALESLTSVFGMGTGVTSLPSLPDCIHLRQESF